MKFKRGRACISRVVLIIYLTNTKELVLQWREFEVVARLERERDGVFHVLPLIYLHLNLIKM